MPRYSTKMKRSRPRSSQGFALVTAIIFLVVVLALGGSMVAQGIQELNTAARAKKDTIAFNLAEAGIDYAAWKVYNGAGATLPVTWSRSEATGSFSVIADRFSGSTNTLVLSSTGTTQGYTAQVKVVGTVMTAGPSQQNAVFDNAMFSNSTLDLKGSPTIEGDIMANGAVTIKGNPTVTGSISSAGTVSAGDGYTIKQNVSKLSMPVVDINLYRSKASVILSDGASIPSTLDGVVFVDGSMHINGNTKISGKGVIVVSGDVIVNGGAVVDLNSSNDEFAIVTIGSVITNGNCTIEGWVYAHSIKDDAAFTGNGTADIIGGIAADVIPKASGSLSIIYKKPTVDLPGATGSPPQFAAVSWRRVR